MNALIAVVIFTIGVIGCGVYVYIERKKIFGIPDYKTLKYGVKVWFNKNIEMNGLDKIDNALDKFSILIHQEFPGIAYEALNVKYSLLKVKICDESDLNIYIDLDDFKLVNPSTSPKIIKIIEEEPYALVNGKTNLNNLFIRKLGNDFVKDTAFIHELMHYIIDCFQIMPNNDYRHENKVLWESGIVGKVISSL